MTDNTNQTQPDDQTTDQFSLDVMLDALADELGRLVLRTLAERRPAFDSWDEMALGRSEFIHRYAAEADVDTMDTAARMHHSTFPKLEDLGFIRYDADDHTVSAANPDAITTAIHVLDVIDRELAVEGERT